MMRYRVRCFDVPRNVFALRVLLPSRFARHLPPGGRLKKIRAFTNRTKLQYDIVIYVKSYCIKALISLPPRGRGTAIAVEGACATMASAVRLRSSSAVRCFVVFCRGRRPRRPATERKIFDNFSISA